MEEPDLFPYVELRRAKLCLDCEVIFQGSRCPACSSESYVPVTRWIRPTDRVETPRPNPVPPPAPPPISKPRRLLRKSLYVGLGAYGAWKMLFEPTKRRRPKPSPPEGPSESPE